MRVRKAKAETITHEDTSLWQVAEEGKSYEVQQQLIKAIKEGRKIRELSKSHPARIFGKRLEW